MSKELIKYGHVDDNGKLFIYQKDDFHSKIKSNFKKTSIEIILREKLYKFSDNRRSYYFGVIVKEIQKAWLSTGIIKSLKDVDIELRNKFLYHETLNEDTGLFEKTIHTLRKYDTSVSVKMMKDYCEHCIIWSIQNLDWAIPYPNEDFGPEDMTEKQNVINNGVTENSTF